MRSRKSTVGKYIVFFQCENFVMQKLIVMVKGQQLTEILQMGAFVYVMADGQELIAAI